MHELSILRRAAYHAGLLLAILVTIPATAAPAGSESDSVIEEVIVTAWCKNCGDKEYVSGLTPVANFFNQKFYGDPRTYGATLRWQY